MLIHSIFKRTVKFISGLIDRVFVIIFILLLLIGAYSVYDSWYVLQQASDRTLLAYKPQVDSDGEVVDMGPISDEMVAWITFDDTTIDYPIMQGADNSKYVTTDPYGNYALSGSIFLDSRNSPYFTDEYSLIYGHHMASGHMFGALDDFLDEDYFKSHQSATLIINGQAFKVHLFAVCPADASEVVTFNPPLSEGLIEYIREYHYHYDGSEPQRFIGFSTCTNESTTSRLIVYGYVEDNAALDMLAEKIQNESPSFR